jgi:hypothetical protein
MAASLLVLSFEYDAPGAVFPGALLFVHAIPPQAMCFFGSERVYETKEINGLASSLSLQAFPA